MSEASAIEIGQQALLTGLTVCAPMLAAGLLIGLLVSIVLAATQIQEFTLTFIPKLLAMAATAAFCAPWILRTLVEFARWIFQSMAFVGGR